MLSCAAGSDTLTFYSSTEIQPDRIVGTFSAYARLPRTMILTGSTRALIVLRTSSPLTFVRMTYAVRATSDIQIWSFRISPLSCADATAPKRPRVMRLDGTCAGHAAASPPLACLFRAPRTRVGDSSRGRVGRWFSEAGEARS